MVNIKCLEKAGFCLSELFVAGGMSKSNTILQIKADITGIPVKRLKVEQTGTMAMAILGSVAMGAYKDVGSAVKNLVKYDAVFIPDIEKHKRYCELFGQYEKMYYAVKTVYGGEKSE